MQCLSSDIGGAPAALLLMTAAATLDPLTARHYIRRHYLNTQQSEIEFRAPSLVPPTTRTAHTPNLPSPFCWFNWPALGSHSLLIVRASRTASSAPHPLSNWISLTLTFYVPESATDSSHVHAGNVCVCVCWGGGGGAQMCPCVSSRCLQWSGKRHRSIRCRIDQLVFSNRAGTHVNVSLISRIWLIITSHKRTR